MNKAKIAKKGPFLVDLEDMKTYAWCACGESQKQPFCDGAHKTTQYRPKMFTVHENKQVYLCGCKQTSNAPHCDGTHKKL